MKVAVGHKASSTRSLQLYIPFKCCYSGAENVNSRESLTIMGTANGTLWDDKAGMQSEANQAFLEDLARKERRIKESDFDSLRLECKGEKCGRRQLWSNYVSAGGLIGALVSLCAKIPFLIFGLMALSIFAFSRGRVVGWTVIAIPLFPSVIQIIRNIVTGTRIKKLPAEYLPRLGIKTSRVAEPVFLAEEGNSLLQVLLQSGKDGAENG